MFGLSHTIFVLWEFIFHMSWELYGYLLHLKHFKKPITSKCLGFPILSLYYGFSHVLENVCISVSPETFKKPIISECLEFPVLSLFYGNSFSPCFGNWMDFCSTWNIKKPITLECLGFLIISLYYENSFFPMYQELYGFLLHLKSLRNL